jgi:hypothetical protein
MIYTIGHKENYLKAISDSPTGTILKLGRCDANENFPQGYCGGYAFKTMEEAQKRIDEAHSNEGFIIFGLQSSWDNTVPSNIGWWNNLIDDSEIIVL